MALSEPVAVVVAALITGVLTGTPALWIARRRNPLPTNPRRATDLWQKQAKELDERLSAQYERTIAYLEAQNENLQRQLATARGSDDDG